MKGHKALSDWKPIQIGDRLKLPAQRDYHLRVVEVCKSGVIVDMFSKQGVNHGHRHLVEWREYCKRI